MNAIVEQRPTPTAVFRDQFQKMTGEVGAALPPHVPVERFMRVVLTAVNSNPDLLGADRRSLMESAMKAAQDGLLPDGRDGAFVVFNTKAKDADGKDKWIKKVQWMPMIGGILKKVRNSGELVSISAYVAYEHDEFVYELGDDEKITHKPAIGERGKARLAYAIARTKDGGIYREIMTVAEIEKVRAVSRAGKSGPWVDWWDEMARKTVLRRLCKRLPMSSDLDDLIRRDDELYDFKGGAGTQEGAMARLFQPVVNPLADEAPAIEHEGQNPLADEPATETGEHPSGHAAGHQPAAASDSSSQAAAGEAGSAMSTDTRDTAAADQDNGGGEEAASDAAADPAFAAGVEAAMKGASRKAVPADIKGDQEKTALWHAGFDSVSGK
jgi:recombination protein RecT